MSIRTFEGFGRTKFCTTGYTEVAFEKALAAALPWIRGDAGRLTGDKDLREDLIQEAAIFLWELDVTRFDWTDPEEVKYVRRAVQYHMYRYLAEGSRALEGHD